MKRNDQRQVLGKWGEICARNFLVDKGLTFIEGNYRTSTGEIDLVMQDGEQIVFVEVKTRRNISFGYPEEAVTEKKIGHIFSAAQEYVAKHPSVEDWRVDVIAIQGRLGEENPIIDWFEDAA